MSKTYFFCGIGGSGMLPLAVLLKQRGYTIHGSDRSYDQGKNLNKFQSLKDIGIILYPQDGSGISKAIDHLVVSSAIENTIPDVRAALELKIPIIKRGALLAECFNAAQDKIAIAGTSGKSTVTGMIGTMLIGMGQDPTIVNGGEILNLDTQFSGIHQGRDDLFIAEMDESDGSIDHYNPSIALLNNIALDHKSMEELEVLFGEYINRASRTVIINADQPAILDLVKKYKPSARIISYAVHNTADLMAYNKFFKPDMTTFDVVYQGKTYSVAVNVPGAHNIQNALAALCVCIAMGFSIERGISALAAFRGIHRRLEVIGTQKGITVIDDFAHNPDKIAATLATLKTFKGRLIVMFQPHGFGPLKLMGKEIVGSFQTYLDEDDILLMPEAYYAGGTVDRSVTAKHLIEDLQSKGINAHWFETRGPIAEYIKSQAHSGDRVIIMGARDDTLHLFARDIFKSFSS